MGCPWVSCLHENDAELCPSAGYRYRPVHRLVKIELEEVFTTVRNKLLQGKKALTPTNVSAPSRTGVLREFALWVDMQCRCRRPLPSRMSSRVCSEEQMNEEPQYGTVSLSQKPVLGWQNNH
jgi:hypothetical protein